MSKAFRIVAVAALLGIAMLPAEASEANVAVQDASTTRHPGGAAPSWQGKPGATHPLGVPPQGTPLAGTPAPAVHPVPVSASAPGKKTPEGEQFFIVASLDLQKSQLLLKYPTEVTLLVIINSATKFADESGKPLKLSDFRAGDTVWMVSSPDGQGEATAIRIRKGQMTAADLHRYYLNYAEIK